MRRRSLIGTMVPPKDHLQTVAWGLAAAAFLLYIVAAASALREGWSGWPYGVAFAGAVAAGVCAARGLLAPAWFVALALAAVPWMTFFMAALTFPASLALVASVGAWTMHRRRQRPTDAAPVA